MILEEILAEIGDAGRFQFLFALVVYGMEVIIAWSTLQVAIVGATPDWWCVDPSTLGQDNLTLDNTTFHTCSPSLSLPSLSSTQQLERSSGVNVTARDDTVDGCVRYYDPEMVTIVSEWDLVCERKYIKVAITSIQMAGMLMGAVACGQLADTVGRRVTFLVIIVTSFLSSIIAGFSISWEMYAALRFFIGLASGFYIVLHNVYIIEFMRHTWRPYVSAVPTWLIAAGLLSLAAWRVPHWRHLHYICAGMTVPVLLGWFVCPESVRWLAAKGRTAAAEKVIDRIARMNGHSKTTDTKEQLALIAEEEQSHGNTKHKYSYHLLFRGWGSVLKTSVMGFVWLSMSVGYYGILFGVSALAGNVYLNMFLMFVIEFPVCVVAACLMRYVGRRYSSCGLFMLASLAAFTILIVDRTASAGIKDTIISALATCSKNVIAGAWACVIVFMAELYPTVIRSLSTGWANTAARVGGVVAPFLLEMETPDDAVKCYVIVGCLMAVCGLLVLLLRETKGKALPDTLHQQAQDLNI